MSIRVRVCAAEWSHNKEHTRHEEKNRSSEQGKTFCHVKLYTWFPSGHHFSPFTAGIDMLMLSVASYPFSPPSLHGSLSHSPLCLVSDKFITLFISAGLSPAVQTV